MEDVIAWIQDHLVSTHVLSTSVLVLVLIAARWIVLRRLRLADGLSADLRRRWAAQVRTASLLVLALGLMIIWGAELKTFAISIVAIAAAIVIATKELIMCVSGALLKASGRSFRIGDRIEVGVFRGDVVDQTLLATTILEVGPGQNIHQHTGRAIILPNSLFLTTPVVNETFLDEFVLHAFMVPLPADADWPLAESDLLQAAREECAGFLDEARSHIEDMVRREGLEPLSVEPRVTLRVEDAGKIVMLARVPVPARRKGRIEQAILRRFLQRQASRQDMNRDASGAD